MQQVPVPAVTVVTRQPVVTQVTFGKRPVTYTDSDGNQVIRGVKEEIERLIVI
jgi:hypothetical protein